VADAIADTGPIRHLHEIGRLAALAVFDSLRLPDLVAAELNAYGLTIAEIETHGLSVTIVPVDVSEWTSLVGAAQAGTLQPADAQVLVLAQADRFVRVVATDDLAVRRRLEDRGATVVGSVGILVRAYTSGRLTRADLDEAIDALLTRSTLFLSPAFRAYLRRLLADLP
jgi:predicted nucleic acid-binding protein